MVQVLVIDFIQLFKIEIIMVQLNLNLTEHVCSMGTTRHVFYFTHTQACVCMKD